ncbi:uncharacterized protein LOC126326123 [Schistocerca gregaria]|uniref:uncharacterized protein LOC126326123 n=1 Tax=Schistocerca gregaria TaxID=7010 RepID=UPI00211DDD1B|nr:uncharacterized protein LOC126326123 [Schistocerca gregaria]
MELAADRKRNSVFCDTVGQQDSSASPSLPEDGQGETITLTQKQLEVIRRNREEAMRKRRVYEQKRWLTQRGGSPATEVECDRSSMLKRGGSGTSFPKITQYFKPSPTRGERSSQEGCLERLGSDGGVESESVSAELEQLAGKGSSSGGQLNSEARRRALDGFVEEGMKAKKKVGSSSHKNDFARNPVDKFLRSPADEGYDSTSLWIPPEVWSTFSEPKRQYWEYKKDHFDEIVFFQQGDFYCLFAGDADVGVEKFGLVYNQNLDSVGVNRRQVEEWVSKFVNQGYKVAMISQESTARSDEEKKKKAQSRATEKRKVTCVVSAGTYIGDEYDKDEKVGGTRCLMSVVDKETRDGRVEIGLSIVDVSTYRWDVFCFEDDDRRSKLETLVLQARPKEVLWDKKRTSRKTRKALSLALMNACYSDGSFPERQDVLKILSKYFSGIEEQVWDSVPDPIVRCMLSEDSTSKLAMSSLCAVAIYFGKLVRINNTKSDQMSVTTLDTEMVPRARYTWNSDKLLDFEAEYMTLDAMTLKNLEILENSDDGGTEGTLLSLLLSGCSTPFGRRRMRRRLCHPMRRVADVLEVQEAVGFLCEHAWILSDLSSDFRGLGGDLERLSARVRSKNISLKLFLDFVDLVEKLNNTVSRIKGSLSEYELPRLLARYVADFPDQSDFLDLCGFDREAARREEKLVPGRGADARVDELRDTIASIEREIEEEVSRFREKLGDQSICLREGKSRCLWVTVTSHDLNVPNDWQKLKESKKNAQYSVPIIDRLKCKLNECNDRLEELARESLARYVEMVNDRFLGSILKCVDYASELDVILSFSRYSDGIRSQGTACVPNFISYRDGTNPVIDTENMIHPFARPALGSAFVPNDLKLGGDVAPTMVVMGPNMGGKSTLLRQVCILVIMAHLGCMVPASRFDLSPVDRIFTRIGASDNLLANQSTFLRELQETASVLKSATRHSLVILDELGRGTSTFDGYSIAYSVLHYLSSFGCRLLFSTHYHRLVLDLRLKSVPFQCVHMASHQSNGSLVFSYRLSTLPCLHSLGLEVAAMADLPVRLLEHANEMADQLDMLTAKHSGHCRHALQATALRSTLSEPSRRLQDPVHFDYAVDELKRIWRQTRRNFA